MRPRGRRFVLIAVVGALLALGTALTLIGLRDSVVYFYPPSELAEKARPDERVRIGGLVAAGSVRREGGALFFAVTDGEAQIAVRYNGQPPDLFREGQGVVAEGRYQPGAIFTADTLLARHDETYMPREVAEALKERGEWRGGP
ncbi:MAG: cytochrome c maturation protein CcmE [Hyphomonadaceae bacterium]